MVRIEVTGADEAAAMFEKYGERVSLIPEELDKAGQELTQRSRSMAQSKGLYRTGAGISGLNWDTSSHYSRVVGWSPRPRLHLLFHEIGTYKDPPRPHIRPAASEYQGIFANNMQNTLFKI